MKLKNNIHRNALHEFRRTRVDVFIHDIRQSDTDEFYLDSKKPIVMFCAKMKTTWSL